MKKIWYLLKCPEGDVTDYVKEYQKMVNREGETLKEVIYFQYQKLMRYGGEWHLERRALLPGYLFLLKQDGALQTYGRMELGKMERDFCEGNREDVSVTLCEPPYAKKLCSQDGLIKISRGIIQNGKVTVMSGPLMGKEYLIRKIDRHKRTAAIEIPLQGEKMRVTVGLEIYEKGFQRKSKGI